MSQHRIVLKLVRSEVFAAPESSAMPTGARGGTRTRMGLPPRDFKSLASTDFATPAGETAALRDKHILRSLRDLWIKAGNGTRTRDPNLGKVVLYQLSYSREGRKIA